MQIGHKMTELEAFEVLSVVLEHPVYIEEVGHVQTQVDQQNTQLLIY